MEVHKCMKKQSVDQPHLLVYSFPEESSMKCGLSIHFPRDPMLPRILLDLQSLTIHFICCYHKDVAGKEEIKGNSG